MGTKKVAASEVKEYCPSSSYRAAAKPVMVSRVDERNKLVKVVPDAPIWPRSGKSKWMAAKVETAGWLLKQLDLASEEAVLKVFQARNKLNNERYNSAFDKAYVASFANHMRKPAVMRQLGLIEDNTPDVSDYFNDLAWEDVYTYALDVMYAIKAKKVLSQWEFKLLTGAWVKFIGPVDVEF